MVFLWFTSAAIVPSVGFSEVIGEETIVEAGAARRCADADADQGGRFRGGQRRHGPGMDGGGYGRFYGVMVSSNG